MPNRSPAACSPDPGSPELTIAIPSPACAPCPQRILARLVPVTPGEKRLVPVPPGEKPCVAIRHRVQKTVSRQSNIGPAGVHCSSGGRGDCDEGRDVAYATATV